MATAKILDGKALADQIRQEIAAKVKARVAKGLRAPGLAVIIIGEDPASKIYVARKRKACHEIGFISKDYNLPTTTTEAELLID